MNSKLRVTAVAGVAALALLSAGAVLSQDKGGAKGKGQNQDAAKAGASSPSSQAADAARMAHQLARYGDAKKDALALITAAKVKKETGEQELKAERSTDQPKGKKPEATAKPGADIYTVEAILERARAAAGGRKDLLALADDVAKSGGRGATGGPRTAHTVVCSNCTDRFRIFFDGGLPARVAISGDGDSRLDLYVYDENGNNICRQVGPGDDARCAWTPSWTGAFTIRVVNYGIANQYRLWTN